MMGQRRGCLVRRQDHLNGISGARDANIGAGRQDMNVGNMTAVGGTELDEGIGNLASGPVHGFG